MSAEVTDAITEPPLAKEYKLRHSDDNINSHDGFSDSDYDLEDELDDDLEDEDDDDLDLDEDQVEEKDYRADDLEDDL